MKAEFDIALKATVFEELCQVNKLGIFQIDNTQFNMRGISNEALDRLFHPVNNEKRLSRGLLYYDVKEAILNKQIIVFMLENISSFQQDGQCAIYENVINILSVIWYSLKRQRENNIIKTVALYDEDEYLLIISKLINLYINALLGNQISANDLSYGIEKLLDRKLDFEQKFDYVCEYDNKTAIIKELCFLRYADVISRFNYIITPLFGAFYINMFFRILNEYHFNFESKTKSSFIQIGFHDQNYDDKKLLKNIISNDEIISAAPLHENHVLILDDNIGTGRTIQTCKQLFQSLNYKCQTRVCETPWKPLLKLGDFSHIVDAVDLPTCKENFLNLSKKQFIRIIRNKQDITPFINSLNTSFSGEVNVTRNNYKRITSSYAWETSKKNILSEEMEFISCIEESLHKDDCGQK